MLKLKTELTSLQHTFFQNPQNTQLILERADLQTLLKVFNYSRAFREAATHVLTRMAGDFIDFLKNNINNPSTYTSVRNYCAQKFGVYLRKVFGFLLCNSLAKFNVYDGTKAVEIPATHDTKMIAAAIIALDKSLIKHDSPEYAQIQNFCLSWRSKIKDHFGANNNENFVLMTGVYKCACIVDDAELKKEIEAFNPAIKQKYNNLTEPQPQKIRWLSSSGYYSDEYERAVAEERNFWFPY